MTRSVVVLFILLLLYPFFAAAIVVRWAGPDWEAVLAVEEVKRTMERFNGAGSAGAP